MAQNRFLIFFVPFERAQFEIPENVKWQNRTILTKVMTIFISFFSDFHQLSLIAQKLHETLMKRDTTTAEGMTFEPSPSRFLVYSHWFELSQNCKQKPTQLFMTPLFPQIVQIKSCQLKKIAIMKAPLVNLTTLMMEALKKGKKTGSGHKWHYK